MADARWGILRDPQALAEAAAERIVEAIADAGATPAICLTGGTTPRRVYDLLRREPFASRIPWARVHWFVGDERFVSESDERSNLGQARRLFLDRCAPGANVHAVHTEAADVHAAARAYEDDLRVFSAARRGEPLFDLVLLGVGPDGHVASLFPGSAAAQENDAWVVGVEAPGLAPFTPRVSLTLPALSSTCGLLFMAEGEGKAPVLARVARADDLPATRVSAHGRVDWLVDAAAAPPKDALAPRIMLVMGVSGSGKTTVGSALAARIGWSFLDADDLHAPESKAKMHAGAALTDADRAPWLARIAQELARLRGAGADVVLGCSALKRAYRNEILAGFARSRTVHLRGAPALIAQRLEQRQGHFMPPSQLGDQLATLEDPEADEHALIVDVEGAPETQVEEITTRLRAFIESGRAIAAPDPQPT